MNNAGDSSLQLPVPALARKAAIQFAQQQPTPEKATQVHLNTLAIWVVNDYLQMMGVATQLTGGDSWNPVVQLCADVADLEVVGIGRLECRPVGPDATQCHFPPEVWSDRIGYVVVRIDSTQRQATLLGFTPIAPEKGIPLIQLQPLESLLAHLSEFTSQMSAQPSLNADPSTVNLSQWLRGVFARDWQAVDALLGSAGSGTAFSFRSAGTTCTADLKSAEPLVQRAKLMDLGPLGDLPLALVVDLKVEDASQQLYICVQAHPTGGYAYLPPNLQLTVLDESGTAFLEAQSRQADNYIQLQFSGRPGERFSVTLTAPSGQVAEQFVI
jgi:hypothetical protein